MARKQKKSWALGALRCDAHTRSEARADFKRQLGIRSAGRLPPHSFVAMVKDPN